MLYILADNQQLTRLGVENLLARLDGAETRVVDAKARLSIMLERVGEAVVVLDFTLFDFKDAEDLILMSQRFSGVHWVLLSEELTDDFISRVSAESGSFSLVSKSSDAYEIDQALRCASRHERFVCQMMMEQLLTVSTRRQHKAISLTKTETDILKEIAQGKTTKEIANERCSSFHTVNTHRKNIFRKLNISTAYEATRYALRAGLIAESEYYI